MVFNFSELQNTQQLTGSLKTLLSSEVTRAERNAKLAAESFTGCPPPQWIGPKSFQGTFWWVAALSLARRVHPPLISLPVPAMFSMLFSMLLGYGMNQRGLPSTCSGAAVPRLTIWDYQDAVGPFHATARGATGPCQSIRPASPKAQLAFVAPEHALGTS